MSQVVISLERGFAQSLAGNPDMRDPEETEGRPAAADRFSYFAQGANSVWDSQNCTEFVIFFSEWINGKECI